jgi:hypothetical protein|tara:strand:- start:2931 stop:3521 length:591 start_codon:yes stop_codon:yes gene_type:complete
MVSHDEILRTVNWVPDNWGIGQITKTDSQRKQQFHNIMRIWENTNSSDCMKVFPLMLTEPNSPWRNATFLQKLLKNTTHNIFLMRNDFVNQVKSLVVSFYLMRNTGDGNSFNSNWVEPFVIPDSKFVDDLVQVCNRQVYAQMLQLSTIYHNVPDSIMLNKKLVWVEDLNQSSKYTRPVIWEKEPNIINLNIKEIVM